MSEPDARRESAGDYARALLTNPVRFGQGVLGHRYWRAQRDMLHAFAAHPRVAVKGCNGSGKAFAAADFGTYWLTRYPDGVVIVTGPTFTQLEHVLWGYLKRNVVRADVPSWTVNEAEIKISEDNYALALAMYNTEAFSGWHGRVLIIVDEAPGIPAWGYDAINGIMAAGDVHVIYLGNPTVASGEFFAAFNSKKNSYHTITVSAFDTPNLRGLTPEALDAMSDEELDTNKWPQITKRRWVRDMIRDFGADSPVVQARVFGRFPGQSPYSLYPLTWLERAERLAPDPGGPIVGGVDVAGPGDDETTVCLRCGDVVIAQKAWPEQDPRGALVDFLMPYAHRLQALFVDRNGIGYYLMLHLADEFGEDRVFGVSASDATMDLSRFANYKGEMYWHTRDRLSLDGIRNLQDRECFAQLAGVRYKQDGKGRTVIEEKADVKKRIGQSPDRAEALIMAFIDPVEIPENAGVKIGSARAMQRGGAW